MVSKKPVLKPEPGDKIELVIGGKSEKGTLLDSHETGVLLLKLDNGYNIGFKKEDISECSNPRKLVETYKVQGGPSAVEVKKTIATAKKIMADTKNNIAKLKKNLADAERKLNATLESYAVSASDENVRLKNSNAQVE